MPDLFRRVRRGDQSVALPKTISLPPPRHSPFGGQGGRGATAILLLTMGLGFLSCTPPGPRPYYSRTTGHYITPKSRDYSATIPNSTNSPSPSRGKGPGDGDGRTPPPGAGGELRRIAESYLGTPYRFGGQSRSGIDCSGFVQKVFIDALQIHLPRNSAAMAHYGKDVVKGNLKPGDLVFFKGFLFVDHVGIYMGDGYFIHSQSGIGVTYTRLDAAYFGAHYAGAKRVLD